MKIKQTGEKIVQALSFPPKKYIFMLLVVFAAVFILLASQHFVGDGQKAAENQERIRVLPVAAHPVTVQQSYSRVRIYLGKVEARRTSQLGFEIGGMLKSIKAQEGEPVEEGMLLAMLDTDRLEASKREAEAQLAEIEATLRLAKATLERTRQAQKLKVVSVQELDEARSNLKRQQASKVRIQAQIERISVDLSKAKIFAPYTGSVAYRMVDEGTVVASGQAVLEITETGVIEIRVGLDREASRKLRPGDTLYGKVAENRFSMKIERILPGREQATRVVQIIATPIEDDVTLREADLVEVELESVIEQQGVWLPVAALTENARGVWSCLVAEPLDSVDQNSGATHVLQRKDLDVIALEEERVFVNGDFTSGVLVVFDGVHRVVPNQRVRLAEVKPHNNSVSLQQ